MLIKYAFALSLIVIAAGQAVGQTKDMIDIILDVQDRWLGQIDDNDVTARDPEEIQRQLDNLPKPEEKSVAGDDSCRFSHDRECDDPTYLGHVSSACKPGTDVSDCRHLIAGK
jgi:hypothetical protein